MRLSNTVHGSNVNGVFGLHGSNLGTCSILACVGMEFHHIQLCCALLRPCIHHSGSDC